MTVGEQTGTPGSPEERRLPPVQKTVQRRGTTDRYSAQKPQSTRLLTRIYCRNGSQEGCSSEGCPKAQEGSCS